MDKFQELLWDLGDLIDLPLHVDKHRACRLTIDDIFSVQMELDSSEEFLILGAVVAEIPPGKYREILLIDALKSNGVLGFGALGYIGKSNVLTMSDTLYLKELTADMLANRLEHFINKVQAWKSAIEKGSPAPIDYVPIVTETKPSPLDLA